VADGRVHVGHGLAFGRKGVGENLLRNVDELDNNLRLFSIRFKSEGFDEEEEEIDAHIFLVQQFL